MTTYSENPKILSILILTKGIWRTVVQTQLNPAKEVSILVITIGELVLGAHKSKQVEENLSHIRQLVEKNVILVCNSETAIITTSNIGLGNAGNLFQKTIYG